MVSIGRVPFPSPYTLYHMLQTDINFDSQPFVEYFCVKALFPLSFLC